MNEIRIDLDEFGTGGALSAGILILLMNRLSYAEVIVATNLWEAGLDRINEVCANAQKAAAERAAQTDTATQIPDEERRRRLLSLPASQLELSVRCRTALSNLKIQTIGDLILKHEYQLLAQPNFSRKSLKEVKEVLANIGLHLAEK